MPSSLHTTLCDLLGIAVPILQAGMGHGLGSTTSVEMVAAVSEAGGLGCFGGAGPSAEQLRSEIRAIRMLSSQPFGVDLLIPASLAAADVPREEVRRQVRQRHPEHWALVMSPYQRFGLDPTQHHPNDWAISPTPMRQQAEVVRNGGSTVFHAELVPQLWLLTRRRNSRTFQQKSVPEIVGRVMAGMDVSFELKGTYLQRDYCVQYRESDFDFASRLMEEEGIYTFFRHGPTGHQLVVADTPPSHADLPDGSTIAFDRSARPGTIHEWSKTQELRSGKITLWDSNFELPHKHLEAEALIPDSVPVGQVTHRLRVAGNDKLELYDYPGGYAKRFDGIDPAGGDRSSDLAHIPDDARRMVGIRMQEEASAGLQIEGASVCANFATGYRFMLDGHFDGNGPYVLTSVQHTAALRGGRLAYTNRFTAIPLDLPYRPPRTTPRPVIQGTQTAFVTGPAGQQTFADKYGRVKVQFLWDREGRSDQRSSCWIRVAALHAGSESGFVAIPRIGQEVVVAFEEGDPDRPIIVGTVYNPEQLPPSGLPK